ncbi:ABC transporter permease [Anaerococcus sp.]|uniref:ABC transporter permease n=1 Tax=Anaerococcus sp. TaxID=1872515 RepID=UPI002901EB3C|nr:iron export ABC transporter permease subunit FetB [Anaerococcus sp.]MDU2598404.1 iron export ABC transporter permease subunit FetB [Anaerococcus sp.]
MDKSVIDISNSQLLLTYTFVIIAMIITTINGINRNKEFIISSIRMTVQLFIAGYVLVYIFDKSSIVLSALMILLMEFFGVYNIVSNKKKRLNNKIIFIITISQLIGTIFVLIFFLLIVVRPDPFYDPQYLIPLGGMIIGNAMTGLNQILNAIDSKRVNIEGALMLGATPRMAMDKIIQESFDTAIIPTINKIKNIGIITLPGMMSGQILSGISPLVAIKYQIAIMTAILSAVTISVFLFLRLGYKKFFNKQYQLIRNEE